MKIAIKWITNLFKTCVMLLFSQMTKSHVKALIVGVRNKAIPAVLLATLFFAFGMQGRSSANTALEIKKSSELGFTSVSPKGLSGGEIIPASCESSYEHSLGECTTLSFTADSYSIPYNTSTILRWNLTFITPGGAFQWCAPNGPSGSLWYGGEWIRQQSGSGSTGNLTLGGTFTLLCRIAYNNYNSFYEVPGSLTVAVGPPNACAPNADPANYGSACTSAANVCGQTQSNGTIQCDGSCSSTPPPAPSGYGNSCTSSANACGQTQSNGTIQCDGSCSSTPPPVTIPGGNTYGASCPSSPNVCSQTQSKYAWQLVCTE